MCFGLVFNPKLGSLTPSQNTHWLGHFGLVLEYFQAYWLKVRIFLASWFSIKIIYGILASWPRVDDFGLVLKSSPVWLFLYSID
jgi:hypothetical protein